jgi:predicted acetyltransferase
MTEIRPIRRAEADQFLTLLCQVFQLDQERANAIFFQEPLFDLERKWGLFEGSDILSILTTVPLEFGWGHAIGIAGEATRLDRRGEGHAANLLAQVLNEAGRSQESGAYLFAKETSLYERLGFDVLDVVIKGDVAQSTEPVGEVVPFEDMKRMYDAWASGAPARLRRDARRWAYWRWTMKACHPLAGGYFCLEGRQLRECITNGPQDAWPVPSGSEWVGLSSMADHMEVPLMNREEVMYFMGHKSPDVPQLFLTDQF